MVLRPLSKNHQLIILQQTHTHTHTHTQYKQTPFTNLNPLNHHHEGRPHSQPPRSGPRRRRSREQVR